MAVVAMVKAVASDRSLWLTSCALAGLASATASAVPAKREMDFIGSSRESPSPASRKREGPSAERWEGEGLSGGGHPHPPSRSALRHPLPRCGRGAFASQFQQPPCVAVQQLLRILGGKRQGLDPFR